MTCKVRVVKRTYDSVGTIDQEEDCCVECIYEEYSRTLHKKCVECVTGDYWVRLEGDD
jgi:hypothetical protein